jgi:hypothetical protein
MEDKAKLAEELFAITDRLRDIASVLNEMGDYEMPKSSNLLREWGKGEALDQYALDTERIAVELEHENAAMNSEI